MKVLKYTAVILLASGVIASLYFLTILYSTGSDTIHYLEPEDNYASFASIVQHPELKNKVIYVDFWHTGCGPCLIEFKSIPKVKEHFKDRDDLAFLYLGKDRSIPGEKIRWKKMIENKELSGYHFFMTNEMSEKIWNETVHDDSIMYSFPHYLIIGKDGEVVNNNSPRPSDTRLIEELNKALAN